LAVPVFTTPRNGRALPRQLPLRRQYQRFDHAARFVAKSRR